MGCLRNGMGGRSEEVSGVGDGVELESKWNSDMMNGIERDEGL